MIEDFSLIIELIETLWNVNEGWDIAFADEIPELIETLWNVNKPNTTENPEDPERINRNIVECKYN